MIDFDSSPVDEIVYDGVKLFIKRDDLLDSDFSGNKARKFYYFLSNMPNETKKIVSFGSNQSNAMYSLSVLCKIKNIEFEYYTKQISKFLKSNPIGNFKYALQNGMKLKLFNEWRYPFKVDNLTSTTKFYNNTLFIPEGGRCKESMKGIKILAKEIIEFKKSKKIDKLSIFLPSGTGTTALFLQKSLKLKNDNSKVFTNACVGDKSYLLDQFKALDSDENCYPTVLDTKKSHFGKINCSLYHFWVKLCKETGIEFDLLYDPSGFKNMIDYVKDYKLDGSIMYIHQGGVMGNESMLERYKRKCDENI